MLPLNWCRWICCFPVSFFLPSVDYLCGILYVHHLLWLIFMCLLCDRVTRNSINLWNAPLSKILMTAEHLVPCFSHLSRAFTQKKQSVQKHLHDDDDGVRHRNGAILLSTALDWRKTCCALNDGCQTFSFGPRVSEVKRMWVVITKHNLFSRELSIYSSIKTELQQNDIGKNVSVFYPLSQWQL